MSEQRHFLYIATPYSKFAGGTEKAFVLASQVAGALISAGVSVFSPIAHSHPIAVHAQIDPLDHSIWLPADEPMMHAAVGLIVVCAKGWNESIGMREEIKVFARASKPIIPILPDSIPLDLIYQMKRLCRGEKLRAMEASKK